MTIESYDCGCANLYNRVMTREDLLTLAAHTS